MKQEDLMKALLTKIESIVNGSDETAPKSRDNYIAWCSPGMAFQPEDMQFAVKGITGNKGDSPEEVGRLISTAAEFSRLVNSIPSSHTVENTFSQNGSLLWSVYKMALDYSQVASSELSEEQKAKIDKLRKLFVVSRKVKDIVTYEEKEIVEDSPMIKAYNEKMADYNNAVLNYNNKRLSALNADDRKAVQDFALNADIYRSAVKKAYNDWAVNGYKDDIEKMAAYIEQITKRDLTLHKASLSDRFEKSKLTDPLTGEFYYSSIYPGNAINTDKGWTKFGFKASEYKRDESHMHSETSMTAKVRFGLWSADANGEYKRDQELESINTDDFEMEFSITQLAIGRPWFAPDFLLSKCWRWSNEANQHNGGELLSDGKENAKGLMPAYPTTAIFIKDVKIKSKSFASLKKKLEQSAGGGGSIGYGPFVTVTAKTKNSWGSDNTSTEDKENTLSVDGMQLIGFKCFKMSLSPNPDPAIENWV